ncbi:MAG: GyrI-like domain-containing protein [Myxococcota bacterium]
MHKKIVQLPEIKLVGIATRTSNEREMNPETAQIATTLQAYHATSVADNIPRRKKPNVTLCAYAQYESDLHGEYTYFVGEEVNSIDPDLPDGFTSLIIAPQTYVVFTTDSGVMPSVVVNAWQKIWQMSPQELTAERSYIADFEVYDERASDPEKTSLDIYVGICKK